MSTANVERKRSEAYHQSVDEVLAALGTDAQRGLSEAEARARLEAYGKNELTAEKRRPCMEKVPRSVSRCARHPAAHRDGYFGRPVAVRARICIAL